MIPRIHFKTIHTILTIVPTIGLIVFACVWLATDRLTAIGARYGQFVAHDAQAAQVARSVIRLIYQINYTVYRTIAETDEHQIRLASAELNTTVAELRQDFVMLDAEMPDLRSAIDAVRARADRFVADAADVQALGEVNKNDEALALVHTRIDPTFPFLVGEANALGNSVVARMEAGAGEVAAQIGTTRSELWIYTSLGLLAGLAAAIGVGLFGISRPLSRLVGVLQRMARGETDARITEVRRRDEIGMVARAVDEIRGLVARNADAQAEARRAVEAAAAAERRSAMTALADSFEAAIGGIVGMVSSAATELQATASAMSTAASGTAAQSVTVASAAAQTAQTVSAAAAAAEELGTSVSEIGRQAGDSARRAQAAVAEAERTVEHVSALNSAVTEIGDVANLIAQIAGQTNLLALNATIEAARAGESGRGFAVVANEVKELAAQTARATEAIGQRIAQVQSSTGLAAQAMQTIGARIREISDVASAMAAAITQQGVASREIMHNTSQAAPATGDVTRTIADVAEAAGATGAAAGQVLGSADALSRQSEALRGEVAGFLATVRAA
ncbi:methyl-accepting chemotaxis protein [Methylobacterium sp. J-026]|nr:methyl-accepting chemotaxis protein [Methylobacterium sp. J-026]